MMWLERHRPRAFRWVCWATIAGIGAYYLAHWLMGH